MFIKTNALMHVFGIGMVVGLMSMSVDGQTDEAFQTRKISEFANARPGYCWYNNLQLDQISQGIPLDKTLIIISRLGDKDRNTNLNKRRLHNVRAYLTAGTIDQYRRTADSIIIGESEAVKGRGRVEFYLDGRLINVLVPYANADLGVAECYAESDGGNWCSTARQKLFYPCKDEAKKPSKKKKVR